LPAHVITYLTLALCLFPDDDYTEVATKVTGSRSLPRIWPQRELYWLRHTRPDGVCIDLDALGRSGTRA
jgi:hypothetical protein